MTVDFFTEHLQVSPVIAILRGFTPEKTVEIARECWHRGIRLVEVPLQSEQSMAALRAAAEYADDTDRLLGAGTICTPEETDRAYEGGARFLVAPGFFPESIHRARELGLPYLPGVATPTEVFGALALGLTTQKLFPAQPGWPAALRGPFPSASFVVVGGVTPANAQAFLDTGAVGVGVGSSLSDPAALEAFTHIKPSPTTKGN